MSDGFQFLDIIFFALIAIFVILRLRNVLGRRTGHERQHHADHFSRSRGARDERAGKVIHLPERAAADDGEDELFEEPASAPDGEARREDAVDDEPPSKAGAKRAVGDKVRTALTQIRAADPEFSARHFMEGASGAFEMIVEAFAQGDTASLRPLLGDDVYDEFAEAIRARIAAKQTMETTIVALDSSSVVDAEMRGGTARITIKFVSQQSTVTRDEDGNVVEGDPKEIARVTDIWTFSRNTRSTDPNWALVETRAADD